MSKRKSKSRTSKTSSYYCSPEYHLVKYGAATVATYNLAYRLAAKSGIFNGSAPQVADYFNMDEKTIDRAFKNLLTLGFFRLIESGKSKGESSMYEVLSHKEWTKSHPAECCDKVEFSSFNPLARALHFESNGRIRLKGSQIIGYIEMGLADEEIVGQWRRFLSETPIAEQSKLWKKAAGQRFYNYLKSSREVQALEQNQRNAAIVCGMAGLLCPS